MDSRLRNRWARGWNLALGFWLFSTAFMFRHTVESATSTWITGVVIISFATFALFYSVGRFGSLVASAWLLASAFVLPHASDFTRWHNALLALVIFAVALVPGHRRERPRRDYVPGRAVGIG